MPLRSLLKQISVTYGKKFADISIRKLRSDCIVKYMGSPISSASRFPRLDTQQIIQEKATLKKVLSCHRRFIYPDISCKVKNVLLGEREEEALKLQFQDKKIVGFMHFEFRLIVL
jgi:hypothetical protein